MKRRSVVLLPEALADLQWIYDSIAARAGPATALGYIDRIEAYCRGMDYASERGTPRDDIRPGLRVIGFERRVTLAFTVESERIVILRLFYGARIGRMIYSQRRRLARCLERRVHLPLQSALLPLQRFPFVARDCPRSRCADIRRALFRRVAAPYI